jgi:hypothetical protein
MSKTDHSSQNNQNHEGRIFVKVKSADSSEIEIEISEKESVEDLRAKIINKLDVQRGKRIRLIHCGKMLDPPSKLLVRDFQIKSGAFIHAVITNQPSTSNAVRVASAGSVAGEGETATSGDSTAENAAGEIQAEFRGLDQLCYAGMSADEVQAIRATFRPSIDEHAAQQGAEREESETSTAYRFRLEELWMEAQGPHSEFMLNLPQSATRYRMIRTLRQLGINPGRHFTDSAGGLETSQSLIYEMMRRNNTTSQTSSHYDDDEDAGVGTNRDLMWGVIMGFFLGFIALLCVWDRNIPHKQKIGLLIGVMLQMMVGMIPGEAATATANKSGVATVPATSTAPAASTQPVIISATSSQQNSVGLLDILSGSGIASIGGGGGGSTGFVAANTNIFASAVGGDSLAVQSGVGGHLRGSH